MLFVDKGLNYTDASGTDITFDAAENGQTVASLKRRNRIRSAESASEGRGLQQESATGSDDAKWEEALSKLKAEHKSLRKVSDLDDDEAGRLLQTLRANAHHTMPAIGMNAAIDRSMRGEGMPHVLEHSSRDENDPELVRDIVEDLQKHNAKLRLELKNAVTDAEQMLKASSAGFTRKAGHLLDQLRMRVSSALVYKKKCLQREPSIKSAARVQYLQRLVDNACRRGARNNSRRALLAWYYAILKETCSDEQNGSVLRFTPAAVDSSSGNNIFKAGM